MLNATSLLLLLTQAVSASPTPAVSSSVGPVLRAVADRGAVVTVLALTDARRVVGSFPLGSLHRERRNEHAGPMFLCAMGVETRLVPTETGPPMTDSDLSLLERIPELSFVDLSGTAVSATQVNA